MYPVLVATDVLSGREGGDAVLRCVSGNMGTQKEDLTCGR